MKTESPNSVSFTTLNKTCKKTAEYLLNYKDLINQQSSKSLELSIGNEFYALSKIGNYTFTNVLVTFRDNTKFCAAVITPIDTPWGEPKMPVCAKHAPFISMTKDNRYINSDEAYYICGVLNTNIVVEYFGSAEDIIPISSICIFRRQKCY